MLPSGLTNSDDDWQERLRRYWYPKLHPYLKKVGGYAIGTCGENQHVGAVDEIEERFEEQLEEVGFRRNPVACFKSTKDGRLSEGSWVLLHEDDPGNFVEPGYQLHLTMFQRRDNGRYGRDLYAHHEPDWRQTPIKHLYPHKFPGVKYETKPAAKYLRQLLSDETDCEIYDY